MVQPRSSETAAPAGSSLPTTNRHSRPRCSRPPAIPQNASAAATWPASTRVNDTAGRRSPPRSPSSTTSSARNPGTDAHASDRAADPWREPPPGSSRNAARRSGESLGGCGHDLVVRHVAEVLVDVPAVSERVVDLAVAIAPEHLLQRLANPRPGDARLGKPRPRVRALEREHDRGAADR